MSDWLHSVKRNRDSNAPGGSAARWSQAQNHCCDCRVESQFYLQMTSKQNELLKAKKWTELLMSLAVGHQHVLVFENGKDMHSCRNVGWRINALGDSDRKFSIKADAAQRA